MILLNITFMEVEGAMQKLKRVYLLIGTATVIIALLDLFYITVNRYEIVLNLSFYARFLIMVGIFVVGIRLIKKIDEIFVGRLIELNLVQSNKEVIDDHKDISIEKHEISRKLQIIQSYAKMKKYNELDIFLSQEIDSEKVHDENWT